MWYRSNIEQKATGSATKSVRLSQASTDYLTWLYSLVNISHWSDSQLQTTEAS